MKGVPHYRSYTAGIFFSKEIVTRLSDSFAVTIIHWGAIVNRSRRDGPNAVIKTASIRRDGPRLLMAHPQEALEG